MEVKIGKTYKHLKKRTIKRIALGKHIELLGELAIDETLAPYEIYARLNPVYRFEKSHD